MEEMDKTQSDCHESFIVGEDNMGYFLNTPTKLRGGAIIFCTSGKARVSVDLKEYEVNIHSRAMFFPGFIVSVLESSDDFKVSYFAFSEEIFRELSFKFDHTFFAYVRECPIRHMENQGIEFSTAFMHISKTIYNDKEDLYRVAMAKNFLQCCFFNLYDKILRFYDKPSGEGMNRKEELS